MKRIIALLAFSFLFIAPVQGQKPVKPTAGDIYESIKKLNFLGTVLYVAAHPDDENTRMISYFANDVKARTAYLSLTRGDGGQNLIGPEIRELLGVIRTQELLAARRIDGGEQFFTRANDFGYSKHPDETLDIWNKDEVLKDVVAVIRKFKPDVIINRFNHRTPGSTHGHHTSSAMLSFEAFELASDSNYKTHLENDEVWNPTRLFFNTSWWFYGSEENFAKADKTNLLSLDIGTYYTNRGLSNSEIASLSRSQHQSQGFGSTGTRGSQIEYLEYLKGDFPKNKEVFAGIDTSWNRVKDGAEIGKILAKVQNEFDYNNPSASLPELLKAYKLIQNLEDQHWKEIKLQEIKLVIAACAGVFVEAVANHSTVSHSDTVELRLEAINRSDFPITLNSVEILEFKENEELNQALKNNKRFNSNMSLHITDEISETSSYWLTKKGSLGMYEVTDTNLISKPETPRSLHVEFALNFDGTSIPITKEVIYKYNDPVKGEVYKPFEVLPQVSASFQEKVFIFSEEDAQQITMKVKSVKANTKAKVKLNVPEGWRASPSEIVIDFSERGEEQLIDFSVIPPSTQSEGLISPIVEVNGVSYTNELKEIDYDHIPYQSIIMPSEAKVVRLDIQKKGQIVGYIQGAGDVIPTSLRQMGYTVVELKDEDVTPEKLENFDAVILGVRAYNTNDNAKFYQKYLHSYVNNGGTMIVQYNTNRRLKVDQVAPYKISLSRDRVTEENSTVKIVNPNHEIMNYPNKITEDDFDGWVQERGLYFPDEWDSNFETVISINDKNQTPTEGSLLIAEYGEGNFIYTGLSFFRELPAGVSGAYKLFANMLSVGKNQTDKPLKN